MSKNNNSKKEEKKKADEAVTQEVKTDADAAKTAEAEDDGIDTSADDDVVQEDIQSESADPKIDSEKTSKKDSKDSVIEELQDKVKRQMAEFDNFRKRTEKEKSLMFEMGASDIIKKLLPIIDNFERGFKTVSDEELETPFAKGMDMVYKQTMKMLEDSGVLPIEAVGLEFNPDLHNAVMHVDDDSVGESIVVEEFEKGYTYRDTVIRHSMVKVAN
ncbi:MAG: nucleotide exchange factor GrpE [Eubacteriales bacterium]|nr:nucleotide exchange factor GrpE [Eubacteriales bacterium]